MRESPRTSQAFFLECPVHVSPDRVQASDVEAVPRLGSIGPWALRNRPGFIEGRLSEESEVSTAPESPKPLSTTKYQPTTTTSRRTAAASEAAAGPPLQEGRILSLRLNMKFNIGFGTVSLSHIPGMRMIMPMIIPPRPDYRYRYI